METDDIGHTEKRQLHWIGAEKFVGEETKVAGKISKDADFRRERLDIRRLISAEQSDSWNIDDLCRATVC